MATTYTTHHGEMIDAICRRAYGDESGYVEQVLAANPGLAAQPGILPAGTVLTLPDIPEASNLRPVVSLWS